MTDHALPAGAARAWWLAARPRTLPVAAAPVVVGTALAAADGALRAAPALAALGGALLLQVGANLANDAFDHARGADGPDRLGPPRAAALGWLAPRRLLAGAGAAFAAATLLGAYLAAVGGWPVVVLGALAVAAAVTYVGPGAYGYHGWGDAAVFVFFGPVAVGGTYWVQAAALPPPVWAAALPLACWATAVLAVNNVRDREGDRRAGKRTLAVRFGPRGGRVEYVALVAAAYAALPLLAALRAAPAVLLPACTLPWAVGLCARVWRSEGSALNPALAATARLELAFAALLAGGLVAGGAA